MSAVSNFIKKTQETAKKNTNAGQAGSAANAAQVPEGGFFGSLTNGKTSSSKSSGGSGGKSSGSSGSKSSGSSGSSSAGRSEYWDVRGDTAKEYQTWLNSQGAGLKVDGIWGKKTEAAYQQNKDAFEAWKKGSAGSTSGGTSGGSSGGSGSASSAPPGMGDLEALLGQYQKPSYTGKTDEQLKAEAEAQYEAQYNADRLAAQQKNEAYQLSIQQQIAALERQLAENQQSTRGSYELSGNSLQRMLTARGMGRSTYAGDVAARNEAQMNAALNKLLSDHTASVGDLNAQGALHSQQTADVLAQLLKDKTTNVNNAFNSLKDKDYEKQQAAQQQYNQIISSLQQMLNDRNLTQQQLAESIRQFNEQLAESKRQFNSK